MMPPRTIPMMSTTAPTNTMMPIQMARLPVHGHSHACPPKPPASESYGKLLGCHGPVHGIGGECNALRGMYKWG
jgi:hypothetical protein